MIHDLPVQLYIEHKYNTPFTVHLYIGVLQALFVHSRLACIRSTIHSTYSTWCSNGSTVPGTGVQVPHKNQI